MSIEQAIALFIAATVFFGLAAWWADKAAAQADQVISEGINQDYDKVADNFKYQTYGDQAQAIREFRDRWSGFVSRTRLNQFTESLEEMRILCL